MNLALPLTALGPAGAALLILVGGGSARARRVIALAGLGAGIGATIFVLVHTIPGDPAAARGLETDAWRAGLALGALVVAAAGIPSSSERGTTSTTAHLASAAAAAGALISTDVFTVAAFLVAATAASVLASAPDGVINGIRAARWFVLSDVLAVAGLLLAAQDGMRVPPTLSGSPAALILVAAAIRSGAVPFVRTFSDTAEVEPLSASIALGPMRAQGLLLAGWVALSGGGGARAMAIGGAVVAALAARRAAREASGGAALAAAAALVLTGLGIGGASAISGAVLLAAGSFVGAALLLLGGARAASPTIGAAPLGATFPGAAVVCAAALARGIGEAGDLAVALPAALALLWLVVAGASGTRGIAARAHPIWLILPGAAALTIAVVPGRAMRAITTPVTPFLGAGRPLTDLTGGVPDDLGILFAIAAVGGLVAATHPRPLLEQRASSPPGSALRVPRFVSGGLVAGAAGVLALLWVGIRRGFI
ncbi:MAG TPA: hypothetical protein VGB52_02170 [Actinomycetota bacterium]